MFHRERRKSQCRKQSNRCTWSYLLCAGRFDLVRTDEAAQFLAALQTKQVADGPPRTIINEWSVSMQNGRNVRLTCGIMYKLCSCSKFQLQLIQLFDSKGLFPTKGFDCFTSVIHFKVFLTEVFPVSLRGRMCFHQKTSTSVHFKYFSKIAIVFSIRFCTSLAVQTMRCLKFSLTKRRNWSWPQI